MESNLIRFKELMCAKWEKIEAGAGLAGSKLVKASDAPSLGVRSSESKNMKDAFLVGTENEVGGKER